MNQATFSSPKVAIPSMVFNPGKSYSSKTTPLPCNHLTTVSTFFTETDSNGITRLVTIISAVSVRPALLAVNVTVELPKDAMNISILTNDEVGEALDDIDEYESVVKEFDREDIVYGGLLTGNVVMDIRDSEGLITRFWKWITSFTISGNVILEEEIIDEITEFENSTIVEVGEIISNETEVAVEY